MSPLSQNPSKVVRLKQFSDETGSLLPLELASVVPFAVRRVFTICGVPAGSWRGQHAHRQTQQFIVCVKGVVRVMLYDGSTVQHHEMQAGDGLYVDKMIWDGQRYMTGDDVLLVLCSTAYDLADYLFDMDEFKALATAHGGRHDQDS